jgi:hypothetical protein
MYYGRGAAKTEKIHNTVSSSEVRCRNWCKTQDITTRREREGPRTRVLVRYADQSCSKLEARSTNAQSANRS